MATIRHHGIEIISLAPQHPRLPCFVDYDVTINGKETPLFVRVIQNNFGNPSRVSVSLNKRGERGQLPPTVTEKTLDHTSITLASLRPLREAGVRLIPTVNFQIEAPQPLSARSIRIVP